MKKTRSYDFTKNNRKMPLKTYSIVLYLDDFDGSVEVWEYKLLALTPMEAMSRVMRSFTITNAEGFYSERDILRCDIQEIVE